LIEQDRAAREPLREKGRRVMREVLGEA